MTVASFFNGIAYDTHKNFNETLGLLGSEFQGYFDKDKAPEIAQPFTSYPDFSAFIEHLKILSVKTLFILPNLVLGTIVATLTAAIGTLTFCAKLMTLPFRSVWAGLSDATNQGFVTSGLAHFEHGVQSTISSLTFWTMSTLRTTASVLLNALVIPAMLAATLVTKSAATGLSHTYDTALSMKDYFFGSNPEQAGADAQVASMTLLN